MRFAYVVLALVAIAGLARAQAVDALDEVNAARVKRGLHPFVKDSNLTAGAVSAAQFRAARLVFGHTSNDFNFLPPGTTADAAGCAGNSPSWGFMACAMFESYTYAGAAKVIGRDGNLYCHLFVRGHSTQGVLHASSRLPVHSVPLARGRRR